MLVYVRPSERGPSQGARSGSTGPTWVSSNSFFLIVRPCRAEGLSDCSLTLFAKS